MNTHIVASELLDRIMYSVDNLRLGRCSENECKDNIHAIVYNALSDAQLESIDE